LSAYAGISNGAGSVGIDRNGTQIVNKSVTGIGYTPYMATFTATAGDTINVWGWSPSTTTWMSIDDVAVAPLSTATILNGNFESGVISPWLTSGLAGVETSYPHSGSYDGYMHTGGAMSQSFTAPLTGTYTLQAYGAISNGTGSIGVDRNGTQIINKTVSGSGYSLYTQTFTATAGDTINIWAWTPSTANWMTIDDMAVLSP
jgi:hypothetical protein